MKQYLSILAASLCLGCVSQQPKKEEPLNKEKANSETVQNITPLNSSKTNTEKKAQKDKIIIIKKPVVNSNKSRPAPKTVKTKVTTSNTTKKTARSKITPTNVPKTQVKPAPDNQRVQTTEADALISPEIKAQLQSKSIPEQQESQTIPFTMNKPEPENTIVTDSKQPDSDSETDSNVALLIETQDKVEMTSPELLNIETTADQPVNEETSVILETVEFDVNKLPMNFGDTWFLDRNNDKISNTTRCLLSSRKIKFNDGYSDSNIFLQLTSDTLLIKTNSSIDMTYPDIGLYIDQNEQFPLEELFGESGILIKQNTKKITAQLLDGEMLTVKMGFWPTWPKTETRRIDFALSDFDKAYQSFLACEKL